MGVTGSADLRLRVVRTEGELGQTKAQLGRLEEAHRVGFQRVDARFEELTRLIGRDELRDPRPRRPPKPRKTL